MLAESFLQMHAARLGRTARLTREPLRRLSATIGPECAGIEECAGAELVLCRGEEIGVADLPEEVALGEVLVQKHSGEGHDNGLARRIFGRRSGNLRWRI